MKSVIQLSPIGWCSVFQTYHHNSPWMTIHKSSFGIIKYAIWFHAKCTLQNSQGPSINHFSKNELWPIITDYMQLTDQFQICWRPNWEVWQLLPKVPRHSKVFHNVLWGSLSRLTIWFHFERAIPYWTSLRTERSS